MGKIAAFRSIFLSLPHNSQAYCYSNQCRPKKMLLVRLSMDETCLSRSSHKFSIDLTFNKLIVVYQTTLGFTYFSLFSMDLFGT